MRTSALLTAAAAVTCLASLGIVATPASAAPTNPDGQDVRRLLLTCPGYDPMILLTPRAYGPLPAGFLTESHALVIPYSLDLQTEFGPVQESKKAPLPADAITCQLSPYGGRQVSGTIVLTIKGQPLS